LRLRKKRTQTIPSDHNATQHPDLSDGVFEVESVQVGDHLCILVSGELDLASADKLEGAIRAAEKSAVPEIVIDLTRLRFMDARGLNVLVNAHTRSRQDHDRIRFLPSKYNEVRQVVAVTGASRMFD
jgi:anti-sigma B factor antagonist